MKKDFKEISIIVINIDCEMKLYYSNGLDFTGLLTEDEMEENA